MVNLDTNTAIAFVSEGSPVRKHLKAYVTGKLIFMTQMAVSEFQAIMTALGGPKEQSRGQRLLSRLTVVADSPSVRAMALRPTRNLEASDIMIFGTGDAIGAVTATSDLRAIRAAAAQGVNFAVHVHSPVPLTGQ